MPCGHSVIEKIIVDGMDGAGKSTLVKSLRRLGYPAQDRGRATHMVDRDDLTVEPDAFYIILTAPVTVCRERLKAAGKPMDEEWHTEESLAHYRRRYREIRNRLPRSAYIESAGSPERTLEKALEAIEAAMHDQPGGEG